METPNAGDDSSLQDQVIAASAVMLALSTIAVSLRFYTRQVLLGIIGADDCMILAALIFSIGVTVGQIRQTLVGLGRHAWLVSEEEMTQYRLEEWYTFLLYATSLSCSKISILLLYRRFLCVGWARISHNVLLGIVTACSVWVIVTSFIDCRPLQAVWDKTIPASCIDMKVKVGNSYAHIITDFLIFFLPIPFVARLKLARRQKVGLLLVFCVGFFACLISVIRIATLSSMDYFDMTYKLGSLAIWGSVEVNIAIICACLTTLKPLVARVFPRLLGSSYAGTPRSLGYIERQTGTTASAGSGARRARPPFAELHKAHSNDSAECEMDDLEGQVQRGVYMASPAKAYTRLP